jgi:hypothetical protein
MRFSHSRPPALTQTLFLHALQSLQASCIDPNALSSCCLVTQDPLHLPKRFFFMLFGHSRSLALTQTLFLHTLRSLQTPCIYPNAFSSCSSVSPAPMHLPKRFFFMLFGHFRPSALTQTLFLHALRSLQTSCINPNALSSCASVTPALLH